MWCCAYLWQVDEDLHALVGPHVCNVAEVGGVGDDPRPPVTPGTREAGVTHLIAGFSNTASTSNTDQSAPGLLWMYSFYIKHVYHNTLGLGERDRDRQTDRQTD